MTSVQVYEVVSACVSAYVSACVSACESEDKLETENEAYSPTEQTGNPGKKDRFLIIIIEAWSCWFKLDLKVEFEFGNC